MNAKKYPGTHALSRCLLLAMAFCLMLFPLNSHAKKEGGSSGGGGDAAEAEFTAIGFNLAKALKARNLDFGFDREALINAVNSTTVRMVRERLYINDVERDALNFPAEKTIKVNRKVWALFGPLEKVGLVYHEYLGIIGAEKDRYIVSYQLFDTLTADEIRRIAKVADISVTYECTVTLIENLNSPRGEKPPTICGKAKVTTDKYGTDDAYFHDCNQIAIRISRAQRFDGWGTEASLKQIKNGPAESWFYRPTTSFSSILLDEDGTLPKTFSISLGLTKTSIFRKQTELYRAVCKKIQ